MLFRGFSANPGNAGMDDLAASLSTDFGNNPNQSFSSRVFAHSQHQQAFDFIQEFDDASCLIVIGHSWGGDTAIELAGEFLVPAEVDVALLIQLDSVGLKDDELPDGVAKGVNYFQIRAGRDPRDLQGETFGLSSNECG